MDEMEKRNIIEDGRTPEMAKQAEEDKLEKDAADLFVKSNTKEDTNGLGKS